MSLLFFDKNFAKKRSVQYPVALVMCDQKHSEVLIIQDDSQTALGQGDDTVLLEVEPENKSMKSSSRLSPCASNASVLNSQVEESSNISVSFGTKKLPLQSLSQKCSFSTKSGSKPFDAGKLQSNENVIQASQTLMKAFCIDQTSTYIIRTSCDPEYCAQCLFAQGFENWLSLNVFE